MDYSVDTVVAGRHACMMEVVAVITASYRVFDYEPVFIHDLSTVNMIYAYDRRYTGEVILLEMNQQI